MSAGSGGERAGRWTASSRSSEFQLFDGLAGGEHRRLKATWVFEQVAVAGDDHLRAAGGGQREQVVIGRVAQHARRVDGIWEQQRSGGQLGEHVASLGLGDPGAEVGK